ncbi:MAG TPA: DUF2892 domain-containing protein [Rhodocyclaceae bacterium]|nr:DUF2892 domain-containing protein [Rhodocyclaceae bacterium]
MNINRWVRVFAGSFVLLSLLLAHIQGAVDLSKPSWLWFTLFVGANLLQSGFTRFCPLENMLRKLGVKD